MRKEIAEIQDVGADGTSSGVLSEESPSFQDPFDPASISIETKIISMDALIRRLKQKTIRLAPNFQRGFVWDEKRQGRLIESLMLRIPLPMFYVSADVDGNWDVVDGLQRLTTIRNFVLGPVDGTNSLELAGLEFWGKRFNGETFESINSHTENSRIVNNIMETEMRFTVINPKTPEEVKFNVFKRINTGGMPLTNQEIRHALYQGRSTKILSDLVISEEFISATDESIDDSRMAGRELITRFFAFTLTSWKNYTGDMDETLSGTLKKLNALGEDDHKILEQRFKKSMSRTYKLFNNHSFRKSVDTMRRTPVNKALFDVWGNILADLTPAKFNILLREKKLLTKKYEKLLKTDDFERAISRDATSQSGVIGRFTSVNKLVTDILDEL